MTLHTKVCIFFLVLDYLVNGPEFFFLAMGQSASMCHSEKNEASKNFLLVGITTMLPSGGNKWE